MPDKKWITSEEAARILTKNSGHTISDAYVRRLGAQGKISSELIGKKTRVFNRAEIEAYRVQQRSKKDQAA